MYIKISFIYSSESIFGSALTTIGTTKENKKLFRLKNYNLFFKKNFSTANTFNLILIAKQFAIFTLDKTK